MTNEEKRKHQRIDSLNLSYLCLDENHQVVKQGMGRTLNLSESGILLETYFPINAEHTVLLSMGLEENLVEVRGRPVYARSKEQGVYEVGIEFLDPDETVIETIRNYLSSPEA
jgi:hypothetical protein